jgi:hypothetical protein
MDELDIGWREIMVAGSGNEFLPRLKTLRSIAIGTAPCELEVCRCEDWIDTVQRHHPN